MPIWSGRARWRAKKSSRTSTAPSSSWAKTSTSRSSPRVTSTLPSRRMPFTARCCRRATALKTLTTSRRCSTAPRRTCSSSSTICPKRKLTRSWSPTPARWRPASTIPSGPSRGAPIRPASRARSSSCATPPGSGPRRITVTRCRRSWKSGSKRSWTPSAATATRCCTSSRSSWWPTPTQAAIRWAAVVPSAPRLWPTSPAFRRSTAFRPTTAAPSASTVSSSPTAAWTTALTCRTRTAPTAVPGCWWTAMISRLRRSWASTATKSPIST